MKYSKNLSIKKIFFGLTIMVVMLAVAPLALAQNEARVYLQPINTENGVMTVEVIAENVTEMYGAEFRLKYDPATVSVQDVNADQDGIQIEAGTLLPPDKGFVVANTVNEAEGTITFAMTLLNPAPAANGSGPLARVSFNILQNHASTIDVEHVKLVSRDLQTIQSRTESLTIAGETGEAAATGGASTAPETAPAAPNGSTGFPWWIIAAAILILGGLVLGALIVMGNRQPASATANAAPSSQPSNRPTQAQRTSGARPSAFKQQSFPPDAGPKPR